MTNEKTKTIGILGGMGPEATLYLYRKILEHTPARKDQDHIKTIIYSDPKIPDRTAAILNGGPSPLPDLIKGAKVLEQSGADFILMPCVTAHHFHNEIIEHISIPFIHLLEAAMEEIRTGYGGLQRIGLMATRGTIQTKLLQIILETHGFQAVIPGEDGQRLFDQAVYGDKGIKCGDKSQPKPLLLKLKELLEKDGAEAIFAGCTEIPLALSQEDLDLPFIDPLEILAKRAVRKAYN